MDFLVTGMLMATKPDGTEIRTISLKPLYEGGVEPVAISAPANDAWLRTLTIGDTISTKVKLASK